jgi:hypothetical protein
MCNDCNRCVAVCQGGTASDGRGSKAPGDVRLPARLARVPGLHAGAQWYSLPQKGDHDGIYPRSTSRALEQGQAGRPEGAAQAHRDLGHPDSPAVVQPRFRPKPAGGTFLAQWPMHFVSRRSRISSRNAEIGGSSPCWITAGGLGELQPNGRTSSRRRFPIDPDARPAQPE